MKIDPKYAFFLLFLSCPFQNLSIWPKTHPFFQFCMFLHPRNDVRAYVACSWKTTLITWIFGRAWYPPWHSNGPQKKISKHMHIYLYFPCVLALHYRNIENSELLFNFKHLNTPHWHQIKKKSFRNGNSNKFEWNRRIQCRLEYKFCDLLFKCLRQLNQSLLWYPCVSLPVHNLQFNSLFSHVDLRVENYWINKEMVYLQVLESNLQCIFQIL